MFKLQFDTANDAFDPNAYEEIARILRDIVERVEREDNCGTIRDCNGNTIGNWSIN